MAIAALVFAGSLNVNATEANTAPTGVHTLTTAATITIIQDEAAAATTDDDRGWHQKLKERFVEGGPEFMGIVLLCLILGLAVAIERIIYLNLATTNSTKLKQQVEDALASGGV